MAVWPVQPPEGPKRPVLRESRFLHPSAPGRQIRVANCGLGPGAAGQRGRAGDRGDRRGEGAGEREGGGWLRERREAGRQRAGPGTQESRVGSLRRAGRAGGATRRERGLGGGRGLPWRWAPARQKRKRKRRGGTAPIGSGAGRAPPARACLGGAAPPACCGGTAGPSPGTVGPRPLASSGVAAVGRVRCYLGSGAARGPPAPLPSWLPWQRGSGTAPGPSSLPW